MSVTTPSFTDTPIDVDFTAGVTDNGVVGSTGPDSPHDPDWRRLCALLGIDEPLGKLRERLHQRDGIPVVVTFALPYLLRHAADKPRAWADLCRAVAAIA